MVKKVTKKGQVLYRCEACGFYYKTKALAQKCEDWCNKNKSCNLKFIKYAVQV